MNKYFFSFFLFLSPLLNFSQMRLSVSIQKNNKSYPDKNFFFSRVVDARKNTASIGTIYKSDRVNEYQAEFKRSLPQEFLTFLKDVYPNENAPQKILIQVNEFQIGHLLDKKDSGFVKLNVNFYELRNDSVSFVSNYTERLIETSEDVSLSHSNRMKRIILHATADLEKHLSSSDRTVFSPISQMDSAPPTRETTKDAPQKTPPPPTIQNRGMNYSQFRLSPEDSIAEAKQYPTFFYFLVGVQANVCPGTLISGGNLSFLFHTSKTSRLLLGPNVNYSAIIFLDKSIVANNNYNSYQIRTYDFGLRLLRQIKKSTFFNCNTHALIGKEKTSATVPMFNYNYQTGTVTQISSGVQTTESNFYGFQLDLGAYIIPPRYPGFYGGIDLTIRTTNSGVFDDEAGIKFNVGLKF